MDNLKIYIIYDEIADSMITYFMSKNDRHAIIKTTEVIKKNAPSIDFEITLYQVTSINEDGTFVADKIVQEFDSETFYEHKE